jgi:hypothetical protein
MEISCGVEPKLDPLFTISYSGCIDIGLQYIWLAKLISQELKVKLIMLATQRGCLAKKTTDICLWKHHTNFLLDGKWDMC